MEVIVKLNAQTAGRDKIARLLQYLSRAGWYILQQNQKEGVNKLKHLEYQLSTFRKLLRLGRCLDVLYSVLPLLRHQDSTVRYTLVLSRIANALFLLFDHILWLGRSDLCNINVEHWGRIANKYWLYSITMNLVRDFYEIQQIIRMHKSVVLPKSGIKSFNDLFAATNRSIICLQHNRDVVIDTIKNLCDFFIPFSALGHIKLSPGTIGLLGAISSMAGLVVLAVPEVKLQPS